MNSLIVVGVDFSGGEHRFLNGDLVGRNVVEAAEDAAQGCFSIVASGIRLPGTKMELSKVGDLYAHNGDHVHLPKDVTQKIGDPEKIFLYFKPCTCESLRKPITK